MLEFLWPLAPPATTTAVITHIVASADAAIVVGGTIGAQVHNMRKGDNKTGPVLVESIDQAAPHRLELKNPASVQMVFCEFMNVLTPVPSTEIIIVCH